MALSRSARLGLWFGIPVVAIGVLVALWSWDWFIPIVQAQASSALGRKVTITHLHLRLHPFLTVEADGVAVAEPKDWVADAPPFVALRRLTVQVDPWAYVHGRGLVLPLISLDAPRVYVAETDKGDANYKLSTGGGGGGGGAKIGDLRIDDGDVRVVVPRLKSDFDARVATRDNTIVVDAKGRYAAQPIEAHAVGGALLSLRDPSNPWPIKLQVENGPTHVALDGTLQDPVALKGANVRLQFNGPDMGLLEPLVGFPIPKTPAYKLSGHLDFEGLKAIKFEDVQGELGNSDIEGSIVERAGKERPDVTLNLRSRRVDLADLSGIIGGAPGRATTREATAAERRAAAAATKSPDLLPRTKLSVPRLTWADIHLRYHGAHIEGRNVPLDDLDAALDVVDGRITVHPVSFGVGKGRLILDLDMVPESAGMLRAKAVIHMQNLDVSRLMAATHTFQGAGSISGVGAIEGTGDSLASLLGHGNGEVKMAMAGGDLSALLVDLTGLQFGNALLSALGVPQKTPVQCFVGDLALKDGVVDFKALTLDTGEGITNVGGDVNLAKETIDLKLKTDSKHFSVGSLPTRIDIGGTFKDPSIRPGAAVAARAGAAAGLAVLFAPLAILPTIQFGTSAAEDARCGELLRQARTSAGGKALPAPEPAKPGAAKSEPKPVAR